MDEQAVGTPQCDWIETDYSFPSSYVSRNIKRRRITTAFVQGKSDTRPKTSIHETFPISWEWKNVSWHHSFAVSWTQLLIKCDYSVCNGKTVTSVRVQKVLVAHQETETLSAVTVLPIGNSQKIVSVSSHSFHALEGARQGHCQKYVLILFIKPEKNDYDALMSWFLLPSLGLKSQFVNCTKFLRLKGWSFRSCLHLKNCR